MNWNWSDIWISVGQVLSGVAIGVFALLAKRATTWLKKKTLNSILNDNLLLKQLMTEIRSYYDADRVQLYQFHNGDHYVSGASIQKLSLTHFVTARGVSVPIGAETTHQNIPIGYVTQTSDDILKNPWIFYGRDSLGGDSYFKGLLRYSGVDAALLRGVFNCKHDMIGILVVSWFDEITPTPEQQEAIKDFSTQLGDELLLGAK
jgi:hypothetical protein